MATAETNVTILCSAEGFPVPTVTWHRPGGETPVTGTQQDGQGASSIIIRKAGKHHQGHYTCRVSNGVGRDLSKEIRVEIKPPKIQPFSFPSTLNVGERSGTICIVTAGDKPLTFSWFKDGSTLTTNDNLKVTSNAEFSNLNFGSLEAEHTGNYTCSRSRSYSLWCSPRNRIRVGESATTLCALVAGDQDVKFRWFKENVEINGAVANVKVKNDKKVSVLTVEPATLQNAGNYTCTAENNYGTDAKSATLVVEAVPHWTVEPKDVSVTAGQALRIECSASGFPAPNVSWRRI
ncbi:hypothetical protein MRX96_053228, partial [Rhipicephalus microplus]